MIVAEFRKDSLSEFLRPGSAAVKGDFRQTAPAGLFGERSASPAEEASRETPGPMRRPATVGADELMAHLRAHGPMTSAALLEAVGLALDPGLDVLERLERFGLIARETADGGVLLRAAG